MRQTLKEKMEARPIPTLSKKSVRALLSELREISLYKSDTAIKTTEKTHSFPTIDFVENEFRNIDESKLLVLQCGSQDIIPEAVILEVLGEVFRIPIESVSRNGDRLNLTLIASKATIVDRRSNKRSTNRNSFFHSSVIYPANPDIAPIPCLARLIDADTAFLRVMVRASENINPDALVGASLRTHPEVLADRGTTGKIKTIRNNTESNATGINAFYLEALLELPEAQPTTTEPTSTLPLKKKFKVTLNPLITNGLPLELLATKLNVDGIELEFATNNSIYTPKYFFANHQDTNSQLLCKRVDQTSIKAKLTKNDAGSRTAWYNFIAQSSFDISAKFEPHETKDITRLMIESGAHGKRTLQTTIALQDYFKEKWIQESRHSRTKYRWIGKSASGAILGHTAALRVSDSIWSGIDNIGSQAYTGSWNADFVSHWARSLVEVLTYSNLPAMIQWTFSSKAGVWTDFHKRLKETDIKFYEQTLSVGFFESLRSIPAEKYRDVTMERIPNVMEASKISGMDPRSIAQLSVEVGGQFYSDFISDYGFAHARHTFRLKYKNTECIVTFSNYPYWASINKGHDFTYIYPIRGLENPSETENLIYILRVVQVLQIEMGTHPFSYAVINSQVQIPETFQLVDLLVEPIGIDLAAETISKL